MRIFKRLLRYAVILVLVGGLLGAAATGVVYWLISPRLPSVASLKDVHLQVPLRVVSADGKLIATFGENHRIPVRIEDVPKNLKDAVLAAEDADFYHHSGIDLKGTLRAAMKVILSGGRKTQGGSTITQQVARNFFLSPQKTYTRKITEIFTSFRIENELSKDQILELYLNKMFLGHRNYGVGAAAQYYYGKSVQELTLPECAMIASSFQLPSLVNPADGGKRALHRRNWVLGQMLSHHFINRDQYEKAIATPIVASAHELPIEVHAAYVAEMVRQKALQLLGNAALTGGYVVHTTIDSHMQDAANQALRSGLISYDQRHGYRGPEAHVKLPASATQADYDRALQKFTTVANLEPGLVVRSDASHALVYLGNGNDITLDMKAVAWARRYIDHDHRGPRPKAVNEVVKRGDIIRVDRDAKGQWQLTEVPAAESGLVALDPKDGAVKALVGGFSFIRSKYNHALMPGSGRGPGSGFKPYFYAAALDHGFTPASIINDAPVVFPDPSKPDGVWTPSNDNDKFAGPTRLRVALYKSLNLVAVRLLDAIGVDYARHYATRFGFSLDQLPDNLSLALGTASLSPMSMARGYAVFANGGYLVAPYFISSIDNRDGQPVYRADPLRACDQCQQRLLQDPDNPDSIAQLAGASSTPPPVLVPVSAGTTSKADATEPRLAPRTMGVRTAYLMTSMMHSVIRQGTGYAARALGRSDLSGKTGSNEDRDAWFTGYNANLVTSVWVGFDNYSLLGRGEFGAKAALPIWMSFMGPALKGTPPATLPMPPGIATLTINENTGLPTSPDDPDAMREIFKVEDVARLRAEAQQQKHQKEQQKAFDIF
ncbi:MAG TPA: penicillin-binding protein 1A [Rhodanobacteraceae bacterium]|nr:penicillin-binding protein 1A [Rhodanobacteraceae bacterium]